MLQIIKIEKEDVKTSTIGCNIQIGDGTNLQIVFSREALEELINDYNNIKQSESEQPKKNDVPHIPPPPPPPPPRLLKEGKEPPKPPKKELHEGHEPSKSKCNCSDCDC